MIRSRLVVALAFGAVATASVCAAQDVEQLAKIPPDVRAAIQTEVMTKKCQLTPAEKTKVEAINVKTANALQPVLTGGGGPFERMRQVKAAESAKDTELRGVLTAQQYQCYEASKDEMKQKLIKKAAGN